VSAIRKSFRAVVHGAFLLIVCAASVASANDGSHLWLNYTPVTDHARLKEYHRSLHAMVITGNSLTTQEIRNELWHGLNDLLGKEVPIAPPGRTASALVVATPRHFKAAGVPPCPALLKSLGSEGYAIRATKIRGARTLLIIANEDRGLLYGAFHFLRLLQTQRPLGRLNIVSAPRIQYRLLNHWDNLDGSVERGYAGRSLWRWDELPSEVSPRYRDYARACASLGLNGTVVNNVNANPRILTSGYLQKVSALAEVFRPYGIRVFLSVNFSSPISARFEQEGNRKGGIGDLGTSDPLDPAVRAWWKTKVSEVYRAIPDFGGFLVKASSEGMPGPQEYGRSHADGANMLAEALEPHGGVVMWRSFVYDAESDPDRVKRAYKEFVPLDGQFRGNVFIQAKNGPLDFQPREPVQPLFGAMPRTPMMLELQITQEYLGHSTHLVYLAPMWKEYLQFDTFAKGPGSTLASIIDGTVQKYRMTGIAGVANTGDQANWCGHLFAQANWFAYGRLAWDHTQTAEDIATDWIRMTLGNDRRVVSTVKSMMMGSWEACVNYMTPLGLHHIMQVDVHYGPGPDHDSGREDWRSTYYHRADTLGLGYERSSRSSNAVGQYPSPLREQFDSPVTCPEKYLLWFHHVGWDRRLKSGRSLWEELCTKYYAGTTYVDSLNRSWSSLERAVHPALFVHVRTKLETQRKDAAAWRDTCLRYFQRFSHRPIIGSPE
jgi:alpha-glucuronidase